MAKKIFKLTESDLHNIIENAVGKVLIKEGWRDTYDKWSSNKDHKNLRLGREEGEEGEDLNKKWSEELKAEFPDKSKRRHEFNQYTKSKDSDSSKKFEKDWKNSGGEERFKKYYKKKFGVDASSDVDESLVREAVGKTLRKFISEDSKKKVNEAFEDDFNSARDQYLSRKSPNGMFGFEMKNPEGDWQYGDITYDPNTNTMSCMGVSIEVDPSLSIDQNIEGLYDELVNKGFGDEDFDDDESDYIESRIDTEANMDDFPADIH